MADQARFTIASLLEGKSVVVEITPVAGEGIHASIPFAGLHGSKGLGLEIANIAALPDAEDYAQDAFYRANFTPAEIARCSKEPAAKAAFQGLFAAKRAIVKSGAVKEPQEGLNGIEISFDGDGGASYPGCLLSLSDTGTIAAAACFWLGGLERPASQPAAAQPQPRVVPTGTRILAALVALSLLVLFGIGSLKIFQLARQ
jgi:phosphopantetheinyl transferase (holo-ACP synthase)